MAKPTVAQAESSAQAIPLSDVTITCYRAPHFYGEPEADQPITIPGQQVGEILSWLAQTRPSMLGDATVNLWPAGSIALDLEGLGELLSGMGQANLEEVGISAASLFCFLGEVTRDLAARLYASESGAAMVKGATITLPTPKAVA